MISEVIGHMKLAISSAAITTEYSKNYEPLGPVVGPAGCKIDSICGLWLGWSNAKMMLHAAHKDWTLKLMLNVHSFGPGAIATALQELELQSPRLQ